MGLDAAVNGGAAAIVTFHFDDFLLGAMPFQLEELTPAEALRRLRRVMANTSNYALRLLASLKAEAEKMVTEEGTTLNQFINVAVAEKLAGLRTTRYFRERVARADLEAFDRLLASVQEEPPRSGDEILELP